MAERKNIMDVTKPGKTAASATARPVIVGHGAMIKDPMVKDDTSTTGMAETEQEHLEVKHEKVLQRSAVAVEEPKTTQDIKPAETTVKEQVSEESQADSEPDQSEDADKKESDDDTAMGSEEAIVDAVAGQAGNKKSKDQNSKDTARLEMVQKLVDNKTYALPIKQRDARRSSKPALIVLILLVVAALTGYALIDLGVVKPGFGVPYHLLKKEKTTAGVATPTPPVATAPAPATQPSKTTTFSNAELRVSFDYPTEWGDAALSILKDVSGTVGSSAEVTFTKQPKIVVGLLSKDYKDKRQYVQAPCVGPGFTTYTPSTTSLDNGLRVVLSKSDRQVSEMLTGGLCDDLQLSGIVKFAANKTYPGIEVRYSDKVTDTFDLAQRIADYKKDYNKYFSDSLRQQITALTNSVKEN